MLKRFLVAAMLVVAAFTITPDVAFAQAADAVASPEAAVAAEQDTVATIYWGNILAYVLDLARAAIVAVVGIAVAWASTFLPGFAGVIFRQAMSGFGEKFIQNIVDYAVNATKGATKDAKLDVNVGSEVIANAIERMTALENLDPWIRKLIAFLGGKAGVAEKVFRKIDLAPEANRENVLTAGLNRAASKSGLPHRR